MQVRSHNTTVELTVLLFYTSCSAFLVGIFVVSFVSISLVTLVWLMSLALISALLWRKATDGEAAKIWLLLAFSIIFFVLGAARLTYTKDTYGSSELANFVGEKIEIEGVVVREPDKRALQQQLYLKTKTDTVLVSTDRYVPVSYGDRVIVKGTLKLPEAFATDLGRTFNYPGYLLAKGIEYQISFAEVKVLASGEGSYVLSHLFLVKHALMEQIEKNLPEPNAGLGEGLLLGVKQALGENLEKVFRETGIIHIVVLSGYNIMLVVAFVMYVLSYFLPLRPRIFTGILAIFLFALMVGLSATVVRASIMAAILLLAQAFGRSYLVLRGLIAAGVIMIIFNPFLLVYDIGFQLSFTATLGLILVAPLLEKYLKAPSWFSPVGTFFYATLATQLAVLPLLLYNMGEFSIVAVLVNMLVLPMVPIAMFFTFILAVFGLFSSTIDGLVAFPAYASLEYIILVSEWFATWPFAAITVPVFPFYFVGLAYTFLAVLLWRKKHLLQNLGEAELGESLIKKGLETKDDLSVADWVIEEEKDTDFATLQTKAWADQRSAQAKSESSDTPSFFR